MLRFATAVTGAQVLLTTLAALWIGIAEDTEGAVSEADLAALRIPFETLRSDTWRQEPQSCHDSRAKLLDPEQSLYVSRRSGVDSIDFEYRRGREEATGRRAGRGEHTLVIEAVPGGRGYSVRHRTPNTLRFETVRWRGGQMVVVRVTASGGEEAHPGAGLAGCERRARQVQDLLLTRLGWRG
jgi:hypothetical protein